MKHICNFESVCTLLFRHLGGHNQLLIVYPKAIEKEVVVAHKYK